jgi:hypothetical protein
MPWDLPVRSFEFIRKTDSPSGRGPGVAATENRKGKNRPNTFRCILNLQPRARVESPVEQQANGLVE